MAGKQQHDFPPDEEIVAGVRRLGSQTALARELGVPVATFSSHIGKRKLNDDCAKARSEWTAARRSPEVVTSPEARRAEEQAAELKALRKENKALSDAVVKQESFFDRIVEATQVPVKVPKYRVARQGDKKPARSVVAPIYDQQFGQFVRPTDTPGGVGSFNTAIFDKRLTRWVEGITGNIRDYASSHRIEELILPFGGDHVEGDEIFAGQPWQLELDPARQVWELAEKMDSAVREVVAFAKQEVGVPFVGVYGITGNHGKVGGRKSGARPTSYNWDWLFLKILFDRLRAEPIDQFAIEPGGALFFRCAGHEFQAIHGDQIRGWGGLPYYGLSKFDGRSIRLHSTIYRYLLMGHHHQPAEIPNGSGETIVSGDWVGGTNLSSAMTAASRPQQKVLFVAGKWGVTETARIYFTEAEEAYSPPQVHGAAA